MTRRTALEQVIFLRLEAKPAFEMIRDCTLFLSKLSREGCRLHRHRFHLQMN
jgi:hypothetical protein